MDSPNTFSPLEPATVAPGVGQRSMACGFPPFLSKNYFPPTGIFDAFGSPALTPVLGKKVTQST